VLSGVGLVCYSWGMAKILVRADDGREAEIIQLSEAEGGYTWKDTAGHAEDEYYVHETLADVINAAQIHLDHRCRP
jgi:hypothetical protein